MKYVSMNDVPSRALKDFRRLSESFRFTTELPESEYFECYPRWPSPVRPVRTATTQPPNQRDRYLYVYSIFGGVYRIDFGAFKLTQEGEELLPREKEAAIIRAARISDILAYYFKDQYVREPRFNFSEERARQDLESHPQIKALLDAMRAEFNTGTPPRFWSPIPRERKQRAPESYARRGTAKATMASTFAKIVEIEAKVVGSNAAQAERMARLEKCVLALAEKIERLTPLNAGQIVPAVVSLESGQNT